MVEMDREADAVLIGRSLEAPLVFGGVFDRHFDYVHRYLARRVGSDLADDLASETFTTAFRVRARYDTAHDDARPWLLGIATNLIRHHRRDEARRLRAYARVEVARAAGIEEGCGNKDAWSIADLYDEALGVEFVIYE